MVYGVFLTIVYLSADVFKGGLLLWLLFYTSCCIMLSFVQPTLLADPARSGKLPHLKNTRRTARAD